MVDVADGGVEHDGDVIGGQGGGNHFFHGGECFVGLVVGELADDDAAEAVDGAAEAELVEDAFHLVDGLADVFYEED